MSLQRNKECYVCGTTLGLHNHHCLYGKHRKKADKYGLTVWLCAKHHNMSDDSVHMKPNGALDTELKQLAQREYEKKYGHDSFMQEFGKNFLD